MTVRHALPGKIVTFYSYKGGVGRSMALANVARLLANSLEGMSQRVLVIDWDLDAPGLHRFFSLAEIRGNGRHAGLIDYFVKLANRLDRDRRLSLRLGMLAGWKELRGRFPLGRFLVKNVAPGIDLLRAGRLDQAYREAVVEFDWAEFFERHPFAIRAFCDMVSARYPYVLVDSRTGYTDISGICTALLPEVLVAVFSPNQQNLDGLFPVLERALQYRRASDDTRPLAIFPVPSRIETADQERKTAWLLRFEQTFEERFKKWYRLDHCDLSRYFDRVSVPYISDYAYGERVAVVDEPRSQKGSLREAYEILTDRLIRLDCPWQETEAGADKNSTGSTGARELLGREPG